MNILDDDVSRVVVEQDTTRRRNEYSLRVLGVVEPDAVLIVQRTRRTAAFQLQPRSTTVAYLRPWLHVK